ncbi:MAG: amidophosphoribosyltransferase [Candidatus Electryonea clarkiae]|nr:amidophosphoribosyltransferase [Candidatus Electryonea clarkiae]MDP8288729.1 amidophosphoribosyltransferase [Candidatus Electryonea clarkiae]
MGLEKIRHHCGVTAVWGDPNAAELVFHGLYSLQHRGQESAGIVSTDGDHFFRHVGMGVLTHVFDTPNKLKELKGFSAIGHNRYSTTGSSSPFNIQPLFATLRDGPIAIGHNGNLVNTKPLRAMLQDDGAIFQSSTDSEIIIHLMARAPESDMRGKLLSAIQKVQGAYSIVMLSRDAIYAARDPHGVRPLCIGVKGKSTVFASESCALDLLGYEYVRDVYPGEIVMADDSGWHGERFTKGVTTHHCIFELIYFSRPDSRVFNEYVDKSRRKMGKNLALEHPADADIVISVPDSSNTAALGYSQRSKIRFELALIRNHYVGRTFIQPTKAMREMGVKLKFNTVGGVLKDKKVVIVEDSIVRGTTLRKLTELIRNSGAKEVHVRVSSPPIRHPCYYGMDFPTRTELIAHNRTVEEVQEEIKVDSLGYLSVETLLDSVRRGNGVDYCTACFTGKYPIPVNEEESGVEGSKILFEE